MKTKKFSFLSLYVAHKNGVSAETPSKLSLRALFAAIVAKRKRKRYNARRIKDVLILPVADKYRVCSRTDNEANLWMLRKPKFFIPHSPQLLKERGSGIAEGKIPLNAFARTILFKEHFITMRTI